VFSARESRWKGVRRPECSRQFAPRSKGISAFDKRLGTADTRDMTLRNLLGSLLGPKAPPDPGRPTKAERSKIIDEYHENETVTAGDQQRAALGINDRSRRVE
jgi:hypothetical protein